MNLSTKSGAHNPKTVVQILPRYQKSVTVSSWGNILQELFLCEGITMMNAAFRRSEALETLENYAPTIVAHLALLQFFPDHTASNHWRSEIAAFEKVICRYNKGKKGSANLNPDMIQKSLEDEMFYPDDEERIESYIHAKGLPLSEDPDWSLVRKAIQEFAQRFR